MQSLNSARTIFQQKVGKLVSTYTNITYTCCVENDLEARKVLPQSTTPSTGREVNGNSRNLNVH